VYWKNDECVSGRARGNRLEACDIQPIPIYILSCVCRLTINGDDDDDKIQIGLHKSYAENCVPVFKKLYSTRSLILRRLFTIASRLPNSVRTCDPNVYFPVSLLTVEISPRSVWDAGIFVDSSIIRDYRDVYDRSNSAMPDHIDGRRRWTDDILADNCRPHIVL